MLPYALAFAAGAMVYVVADDIIPEANSWYASHMYVIDRVRYVIFQVEGTFITNHAYHVPLHSCRQLTSE